MMILPSGAVTILLAYLAWRKKTQNRAQEQV